jgi:hypothetical protein
VADKLGIPEAWLALLGGVRRRDDQGGGQDHRQGQEDCRAYAGSL